jgi:hypothetical protein
MDELTLEETVEGVKLIERVKSDDEAAHALEDNLYLRFITHVAYNGPPELAETAKELLKTQSIGFSRHCA